MRFAGSWESLFFFSCSEMRFIKYSTGKRVSSLELFVSQNLENVACSHSHFVKCAEMVF